MHGLTGSQEPHNWRSDDLLRVGDDLRRGREADARRDDGERHPNRVRGWLGRHMIGAGEVVAGDERRSPCPDLPQMGSHA